MAGRGYLYNSSQGVVGTIIFVEITRTFIIVAEVVSITFTIIGLQLLSSNCIVDPTAAHENNSNWMSTAYSAAKLAINMIKESSDVFPPLKSVAGGLSAILQHCDVRSTSSMSPHPRRSPSSQQTMACRQTIESLVPRVEGLAESLSAPAPEGEVKEEKRRTALKL
jgi:hypothetical protein